MSSDQRTYGSNSKRVGIIILFAFVLFVIVIIFSLRLPEPIPTPVSVCNGRVVDLADSEEGQQVRNVPEVKISPLAFFAETQVIMVGGERSISGTLEVISDVVQLEQIGGCDLGDATQVQDLPEARAANVSSLTLGTGSLKVNLYQIKANSPLTDVVSVVKELNRVGNLRGVFADPNYLVASTAVEGVPNPCASGPHGTGGSPFGSGADPIAVPAQSLFEAQQAFRNQWALEHLGVGRVIQDSIEITSQSFKGNSVRVAVFDTSPFDHEPRIEESGSDTIREPIGWIEPNLTLFLEREVVLPEIVRPPSPDESSDDSTAKHLNQHGLFVSGLIHALAPNSEIHLYRVLDDDGCGDLYTLVVALNNYIQKVKSDGGSYRGEVANLSLGLNRPLIMTSTQPTTDTVELSYTSGNLPTDWIVHYCQYEKDLKDLPLLDCFKLIKLMLADPIESLAVTMQRAFDAGIVVVAAAGNASWHENMPPLSADLPAQYPTVLAVAASNVNRQRACFSNWGDVYAPGGEGGLVKRDEGDENCWAVHGECKGGNCVNALIGLVDKNLEVPVEPDSTETEKPFPQGYAYWSGTSFSTPLVSGLAARVLDKGAEGMIRMPVEQVMQAIRCGAATNEGVINATATTMQCRPK